MSENYIASIKVEVKQHEEDWSVFLGDLVDKKEIERQWEAQEREMVYVLVTVTVRQGKFHAEVYGSLSGIDLLYDTDEHREEAKEYVRAVATDILKSELRHELVKDYEVPVKKVEEAIAHWVKYGEVKYE